MNKKIKKVPGTGTLIFNTQNKNYWSLKTIIPFCLQYFRRKKKIQFEFRTLKKFKF